VQAFFPAPEQPGLHGHSVRTFDPFVNLSAKVDGINRLSCRCLKPEVAVDQRSSPKKRLVFHPDPSEDPPSKLARLNPLPPVFWPIDSILTQRSGTDGPEVLVAWNQLPIRTWELEEPLKRTSAHKRFQLTAVRSRRVGVRPRVVHGPPNPVFEWIDDRSALPEWPTSPTLTPTPACVVAPVHHADPAAPPPPLELPPTPPTPPSSP
jgi:hypothetical protein